MAKQHKAIFDNEENQRQLKELMRLNPTISDASAFFDVCEKTIELAIRKHYDLTFREFKERHMVHTRLGLIRKAVQKAMSGDNAMLIFCLKNLCRWTDTDGIIESGENGFVIQFNYSPDKTKEESK